MVDRERLAPGQHPCDGCGRWHERLDALIECTNDALRDARARMRNSVDESLDLRRKLADVRRIVGGA